MQDPTTLADFLPTLLQEGYSLKLDSTRLRVWNKEKKYEIINGWNNLGGLFIGEVTTFRGNGEWIGEVLPLGFWLKRLIKPATKGELERWQEISDRINEGWVMEYTYYHNPEGEGFQLIDLGYPQEGDFELTGDEWNWIRKKFQYRTEEEPGQGLTRVTYFFESAAEQVA